ncbi:hypothetical protein ACFQPA_00640 [Halomarina halobia]|uniref:DUF456 domain-containing protein n=1 Tax=Halomarina halobia TaxID=3033386 RepID=A0ABD6A711_9EURY|nr:hypothetical protein [Halomarina sp. PSR21]
MSRTDDLLRELETSEGGRSRAADSEGRSRRARLLGRAKGLFSPRYFLVALVLTAVGLVLASAFLPFVPGAGLVGVFVAAFGLGLLSGRRHYLELAVAGAFAATLSVFTDYVVFALVADAGATLAAAGAGAGALVALVGHYFGRDLRSGLTADL